MKITSRSIFSAIVLLFIASCQSEDKSKATLNEAHFIFPLILDDFSGSSSAISAKAKKHAKNRIAYVGFYKDTINLSEVDINNTWNSKCQNLSKCRPPKDQSLKIYISENQTLSMKLGSFYPPIIPNERLSTAINDKMVQTIPVIIYNSGHKTQLLNVQDNSVIMIQEAKDDEGNWRAIESWKYSNCGNSYHNLTLPPNALILVKTIKYTGDFQTELRVKVKHNNKIFYSSAIKGEINKGQFKKLKRKK